MRTLIATVGAALLLAGPAAAGEPTATLAGAVTVESLGSEAQEVPALLATDLQLTDVPSEPPRAQTEIALQLPPTARFDHTALAVCSASQVIAAGPGSCPPGSKVGSGSAAGIFGANRTQSSFGLEVFNGGPGSVTVMFTGMFNKAIPSRVEDGRRLVIPLPPEVQQPLPGMYHEFRRIQFALGTRLANGASFLRVGACADGLGLTSSIRWTSASLAPTQASGTAACAVGPVPVSPGGEAQVEPAPSPNPTLAVAPEPDPVAPFTVRRSGARRLTVGRLGSGARVRVRCVRRCGPRKLLASRAAKSGTLRLTLKRRLRVGAVIEVHVSRTGQAPRVTRYAVGRKGLRRQS